MEKRRSNTWIIIICLLIISAFAVLLWYPMLTKGTKAETAKTSLKDEIDEDEIIIDDQFLDNAITSENLENNSDLEAKAEIKTETETTPQVEAKVMPQVEAKTTPQVETGTKTPIPDRAPEFQGEYMFDKKFDFRLVDFMQANFPDMKLITYGAPQNVVVKEGSRLTLIAQKYYGNKRFWVYIYLYNTDIIQHPNQVPAGTVVKVPKLDKSLADPNNQAHIDAAWDVQKYLLKM